MFLLVHQTIPLNYNNNTPPKKPHKTTQNIMQPIITITFSLKITSYIIKHRHTLNLHRFFFKLLQ